MSLFIDVAKKTTLIPGVNCSYNRLLADMGPSSSLVAEVGQCGQVTNNGRFISTGMHQNKHLIAGTTTPPTHMHDWMLAQAPENEKDPGNPRSS